MKRWIVSLTLPVALLGAGTSSATVSQEPLFLGGSVPGNLAIVPSVEWPTINSVANLGAFDPDKTYVGYFDSFKCYNYEGSDTESERHFVPKAKTTDRLCSGSNSRYWSGNFLNWATTQTIDPFRKALTGGLRAKDTTSDTWLEKAWHDGSGDSFTDRTVLRSAIGSDIDKLLPFGFSVDSFTVEIDGKGKEMLFSFATDDSVSVDSDYISNGAGAYLASVRVQVCVNGLLEDNCVQYTDSDDNSVWKPEGLLQTYSDKIRYSVFGYLNDSDQARDGGVLRARQKFIGPMTRHPTLGWVSNVVDADSGRNTSMEWDPETGVLYDNPDSVDAAATASNYGVTVNHSGVVNYINNFEELLTASTDYTFKSYDPVSELYYAATRYFRGLTEVASYSSFSPTHNSSPDNATKEKWADGFPVITGWADADDSKDPIQYSCQKNAILGIGDVNTWNDRNLPGNNLSSSYGSAAPSDADINVANLLTKIESLEGIDFNEASWRENSGYIAGLALDIHTRDIRDDFDNSQTVETYWVDVLEGQLLMDRSLNQYWLATKYGGFDPICTGGGSSCITGPYDDDLSDMTDAWWHTNGETLTASWSNASLKKPDNYFTAGNAEDMVDSLEEAFAKISDSMESTSTSLSFNGRTLRTGSQLYQATFDPALWSGDLRSFDTTLVEAANGAMSVRFNQLWSAADILDALESTGSRNIFTASDFSDLDDGSKVTRLGRNFAWASLTDAQKTALKSTSEVGVSVTNDVGEQRLDYLRGVRDNEQTDSDTSKPFRQRDSRLGDIVNSDPQYIYQPNFGYDRLSGNAQFASVTGTDIGAAYTTYRASNAYKSKKPLIIAGANDGMLHGFNAHDNKTDEGANATEGGGEELFAYVPVSVMDQLYKLTDTDYEHQYYVDGTPRLGDAWLGGTTGWGTLAVATTGAGGGSDIRGSVFALDISNPDSVNLLWEYTNPLMGKLVQQPALVALANGTFGVIVTSGYDAPQDNGYVWILSAADGSPIKQFELPDTGGVGTPLVVDLNKDRVADRIYVADLSGNVWRIDIDDTNTRDWASPFTTGTGSNQVPAPLFTATDDSEPAVPQPITAPLTAIFTAGDKLTLLFGTGSYFQTNDEIVPENPQMQTFYAIYDQDSVVSRSALKEQKITSEQQLGSGAWARIITDDPITTDHSGWYIDLLWSDTYGGPGAQGERVTTKASISGDQVFFNTLIPSSDPCSGGGISWIMGVDLSNGGQSSDNLFDYNSDGLVDESTGDENDLDSVPTTEIDGEGNEQQTKVPGSGIRKGDGIATTTTVENTLTGQRWVCYAESNNTQPKCVLVNGFTTIGRVSWRELTDQQ